MNRLLRTIGFALLPFLAPVSPDASAETREPYELKEGEAKGISRRKGLSFRQFDEEYQRAGRPVIVTDALTSWPALQRWTPEFFKSEFGDKSFSLVEDLKPSGADAAAPAPVQYTMADFIDRVMASTEENPAPYFRNRVLAEEFPSLVQDIEPLPPYFEPNWLPEQYLVGHVRRVLNRGSKIELYIGGKGGSFPVLHYDGAGTHAFLMQIYGRKKYIVYPPSQEAFLYPSPQKPNLSMINSLEEPDLKRFPLFAKAVPMTFTLEPGELLFVPAHWWHTATMLTPSITVSINTLNQSNWHELVAFVASNRRNRFESVASSVYLTCAGAWRAQRDKHRRMDAGDQETEQA
jgi:hypothetical protein